MSSRRFALSLGTVSGGMLAAAFLHPAVAAADSYDITPDPRTTQSFTAVEGMPPQDQAVDAIQNYNYQDFTTGDTGSITGLSLNATNALGITNQEILVLPTRAVAVPAPVADLAVAQTSGPAQGSFFDTINYGNGFQNVYTDLVGTGTGGSNTITDTVVTPFGNINIPTTFDATAALQAAEFHYSSTSAVLPGYSYVADPVYQLGARAMGGTLPFDQSVSGTQQYDVNDSTGATVGGFSGVSYNDVNASGQTNQEILATGSSLVRAAAFGGGFGRGFGDNAPSNGSLFDTVNYGNGYENVYSDIPADGTSPATITDTFVTPFGNINVPTTFDAAQALTPAQFTYPTGSGAFADFSFVPDSDYQESVTAISGQAMLSQTITGSQLYDVHNAAGSQVGEFQGLSTHLVTALGFSNQEILVTGGGAIRAQEALVSIGDGTNAPAAGSFFDTFSGFGFENVYSDVVGTNGANTITDTLITPFGDFNIPTSFAATSMLNVAEFLFPSGSSLFGM